MARAIIAIFDFFNGCLEDVLRMFPDAKDDAVVFTFTLKELKQQVESIRPYADIARKVTGIMQSCDIEFEVVKS